MVTIWNTKGIRCCILQPVWLANPQWTGEHESSRWEESVNASTTTWMVNLDAVLATWENSIEVVLMAGSLFHAIVEKLN
jgi:hypothetical protein